MEEMKQWTEQMIYLISCALHGRAPEKENIKNLNLEALYKLTKIHSLTAIVCMALEDADAFSSAESEVEKKWKDAKNKAIRKNMLLDAEREQILGEMEKAGIWYMPLKGSILKELYPRYGMRQMADNDILYDPSMQDELMHIFLRRGYEVKAVGISIHDVYLKPPVYNYEMHTALFNPELHEDWADYYGNVKKRLYPDPGRKFGYHFTEEDFYIYITLHAYKHYSGSGTGFRTLLDLFVFNWKKGEALDREYVKAELEKLGIAEFEEKNRILAKKLFGKSQPFKMQNLAKEEQELFLYYCGSGTYGTMRTHLKNNLKKFQGDEKPITVWTKFRYICFRLFPGREWFRVPYPFIYRYPVFIPAFWIYRMIRSAVFHRKRISSEIRIIKKSD